MKPETLLLNCMTKGASFDRAVSGLGEATALTPQQHAALINLAGQYSSWKAKVLAFADSTSDEQGNATNLRNLVASASRSFNRFIGGEVAQGTALKTTMANTMALIREASSSSMPSLQDAYAATGSSINTLIVSLASTAGSAAGALLKSAADQIGIEPAEITGGVSKVALAIGAVAAAITLSQLVTIFGRRK